MSGDITNMTKEKFFEELNKRDISCTEEQFDELNKFMEYVLYWNERFNLTAIKDKDVFMEKMVFDSALALTDLDLTDKKVLDVGTGAGFPGVVLYLLNPKTNITLLDSTTKKIDLLKQYAEENNYKYNCVSFRVEDYAKNNREQYDYVFARAVAPLNILLELCLPLLKVGGSFIALKGPGVEEEINASDKALKKLNGRIQKIIVDELPESNEVRNIVYIQKEKVTNHKYPRDYSEIKKLPL